MQVKTVSETTSCITLSCRRVKGPPLPTKPILLAGTWQAYSNKAMLQENTITPIKGHEVEIFISWSFKWPYHANVMKTFDTINKRIVYNGFMLQSYTLFIDYHVWWTLNPWFGGKIQLILADTSLFRWSDNKKKSFCFAISDKCRNFAPLFLQHNGNWGRGRRKCPTHTVIFRRCDDELSINLI